MVIFVTLAILVSALCIEYWIHSTAADIPETSAWYASIPVVGATMELTADIWGLTGTAMGFFHKWLMVPVAIALMLLLPFLMLWALSILLLWKLKSSPSEVLKSKQAACLKEVTALLSSAVQDEYEAFSGKGHQLCQ